MTDLPPPPPPAGSPPEAGQSPTPVPGPGSPSRTKSGTGGAVQQLRRRLEMRHPVIVGVVVAAAATTLFMGFPIWKVAVASLATYTILRLGVGVFASLATPLPEPPPRGELRKVKLTYRCEICGTEVRMQVAPAEDPDPPRHCQDEMRLLAPVD